MHANSSQKFNPNGTYEDAPSVTEEKVPIDDEDIEDEKAKDVGSKLRREEIWREIIVTSNGRDKVFVSLA